MKMLPPVVKSPRDRLVGNMLVIRAVIEGDSVRPSILKKALQELAIEQPTLVAKEAKRQKMY